MKRLVVACVLLPLLPSRAPAQTADPRSAWLATNAHMIRTLDFGVRPSRLALQTPLGDRLLQCRYFLDAYAVRFGSPTYRSHSAIAHPPGRSRPAVVRQIGCAYRRGFET